MKQNYNTKARRYILEYLESCGENTVSASDILEYLTGRGVSVNLTTVYRCLTKLTNEQHVIKIAGENGQKAVYQLIAHKRACDNHIHIQCVNCGRLIHLDCKFMDEFKKHIFHDHGFELKCQGSILYGVCSECKK